jgi:hypothetical protein
MLWAHEHDRPSLFSMATATTAAVLIGTSSYWIYQCVSEYGLDGALRYVWEGDPYSEKIRAYLDALDDVERSLEHEVTLLCSLEEGLERARLDCIDDSSPGLILRTWESNCPIKDLQMQLAKLSYELDQYASRVDQLTLSEEDHANVKQRKKAQSKRIVRFMERTDHLVSFYQKAKGLK